MAEEKRKTLEEAQEDYQKIFDKIEELREKLAVADNKEKQELKESIAQLEDVLEIAGEKIATAAKAEEVQSEEVVSKAELPDFEEILKMSDDSKKEIVSSANKYGLNQRKIADIVISIDDDDYKKEILSNAKQYGFSDYAILDITNSIKDKEFRQSAYDTSVLTYDPTSKAFAGSSLDLEFTERDTIESVAERLDSFVAEGSITREEADEIFDRVGEELHLAAREELAALQKENSSYEKDKEANIELKEQLLKEDGAKVESVRGYDEAVKQIEAKITDNNKRIESLEKEVENAPKVFDAASLIENNKDVEDSKDQELEKLRKELARVTRDRDKMLADRGLEEKWRKERETTIEELTNDSDYEEKEVDKETRLKEINAKITSLAKEVETLINEYGSNNKNITKLEEKLQKALEKDNTTEVKELGEEISKIRDKNIELKNIINERKSAIESLQEEKELIQADTLALDALTPEEYQEITNTLRDKSIIRQILKQKGLYDIYKKKVEDRTPEEMDQIRNAIKDAATEISNAKLENREVSSLELVKALYG